MNYKYLKRLCLEQRKQIEQWKNYCKKQEDLLEEVLNHIDLDNFYYSYCADKIRDFLKEDTNVR